MPASSVAKLPRVKASVALRQDQVDAIREIADHERHQNFSLIVQRFIDAGLNDDGRHSDVSIDAPQEALDAIAS